MKIMTSKILIWNTHFPIVETLSLKFCFWQNLCQVNALYCQVLRLSYQEEMFLSSSKVKWDRYSYLFFHGIFMGTKAISIQFNAELLRVCKICPLLVFSFSSKELILEVNGQSTVLKLIMSQGIRNFVLLRNKKALVFLFLFFFLNDKTLMTKLLQNLCRSTWCVSKPFHVFKDQHW